MIHSTVAALAAWLVLTAGDPASAADKPFIGNWALTLPGGYPGWLGITQETNYLDGALLWGWGSDAAR